MRATARTLLVALAAATACGTGEITIDGVSSAGLDGGGAGGGGGGAGGGDGDDTDAAPGGGGGMWEAELVFCVDETNRYRAMIDAPPLSRNAALEAYAADGAEIDHQSGEAHKHFIDTQGGGIAGAENEIPAWSVSQWGSVHDVIREGLELMWNEGPGGGHHDNMAGGYQRLGCGIYRSGDAVTVVQDFGG